MTQSTLITQSTHTHPKSHVNDNHNSETHKSIKSREHDTSSS